MHMLLRFLLLYAQLVRTDAVESEDVDVGFDIPDAQYEAQEGMSSIIPECEKHHYGPSCDIYCNPVDDEKLGHYLCNPINGEKVCRNGFAEPETDCTVQVPIKQNCPISGDCINGTCVNQQCVCNPGWTGMYCEEIILGCSGGNPCLNGGTCRNTNTGNRYQCFCLPDWTGTYCETPINRCPPNYYGPRCEIFCMERNDCNGGFYTCDPSSGAKICRSGWTRPDLDCKVKIIPKPNDPECPRDSVCQRGSCFAGRCCCESGWTGRLCDCRILVCDSQPCRNGGTCRDLIDRYQCTCPPTHTGPNCEIEFPRCPPNYYNPPACNVYCLAADDCERGHYTCDPNTGAKVCLPGYAVPENDCKLKTLPPPNDPDCPVDSPCVYGRCYRQSCCCNEHYTGPRCETVTDCVSQPCLNGGTCNPMACGYTCACLRDYTGTHCETYDPQCPPNYYNPPACNIYCLAADDCDRGHYTCDPITGAKVCLPGYAVPEHACKIKMIPPPYDPDCPTDFLCVHGRCYRQACCCNDHYTGVRCETLKDYCVSQPCLNGGTCNPHVGGYTCICYRDYTGSQCETYDPQCPPNYYNPPACNVYCLAADDCDRGHYTCDPNTGAKVCLPGYAFPENDCKIKTIPPPNDPDCPIDPPCIYGRCYRQSCCCNEHYTGVVCETFIQYCISQPCLNGGTCSPLVGGYMCRCLRDYTGTHCETDDTQCPPNYYNPPACNVYCLAADDCDRGHYTCDPNTGAKVCRYGWDLPELNCTLRIIPKPIDEECPDSEITCVAGQCHNKSCCCYDNWTGPHCDIPVDHCSSNPCYNGSTCERETDRYRCICAIDMYGTNCDTYCKEADDCPTGHYTCDSKSGEKICLEGWETPEINCTLRIIPPPLDSECPDEGFCAAGQCYNKTCCCYNKWTGMYCETRLDECLSEPCQNEGTCRADESKYECLCPPNYYGYNCEKLCKDADDCTHGHYVCNRTTGDKMCREGWALPEINCTLRSIPPVVDPDCPENGVCVSGQCHNNGCCCYDQWTGEFCDVRVDGCTHKPCLNQATCIPAEGGYTCLCDFRYTGTHCETLNPK